MKQNLCFIASIPWNLSLRNFKLSFFSESLALRKPQKKHLSTCFSFQRCHFMMTSTASSETKESEHSSLQRIQVATVLESSASGEWVGYIGEFDWDDGQPIPIPERFVPDDFINWGVDILGFEHLTSDLVNVMEDKVVLSSIRTKMLPTVGCEADAAVPDRSYIDLQFPQVNSLNSSDPHVAAVFENGSYCYRMNESKWEHCLVFLNENGKKTRARFTHGKREYPYEKINIVLESWDTEYCEGQVLPGCGSVRTPFSTLEKLQPSNYMGVWNQVITDSEGKESHVNVIRENENAVNESCGISLPGGFAVRFDQPTSKSFDNAFLEFSWLCKPGHRSILQLCFDESGGSKAARLIQETKK